MEFGLSAPERAARLKISIRGAVQGVGFRPFVFRLADQLGLKGWVNNSAQGVFIEAEGAPSVLQDFLLRLESEKPPRSFLQSLEASWLDPVGYNSFEVLQSDATGTKTAIVLPDIATCPDCLREIFDPANRRSFYPFTNCTNCGPRFTIIEQLPYDRANTTMNRFQMCSLCQSEYNDPCDRRFHAQPNACPTCGPHLELWGAGGRLVAAGAQPGATNSVPAPNATRLNEQILKQTADAIRSGKIVALKGLGGFHLMAAAHDEDAVRRLRERKHREEKPLALMFPSMESVTSMCEISPLEARLLRSPEAPIVLLRRLPAALSSQLALAPAIAPGNPNLGVMLPYTPLHHLLLSILGFPVVATSGNLSDEPICIDEQEAVARLKGIADLFLVHNRPIVRQVDDSIARVMAGREMILRRARGYAPLPIQIKPVTPNPPTILAVGAHLKNTIALAVGDQVFVSQHIGDLETEPAYAAFSKVIADFQKLYEATPEIVAADAHPDYLSTKFACELASRETLSAEKPPSSSAVSSPRYMSVQHHVAHVLSCMAENQLEPPVLGVSWDGTGYGLDGTIWGGEFFLINDAGAERFAHWRAFRLPGGDQAIKQPRRTALGLLFELFGEKVSQFADFACISSFSAAELSSLRVMLARGLNSPFTSSAGRLFDAVASLAGLRQEVRFEGQAAMELEFATDGFQTNDAYPFHIEERPLTAADPETVKAKLVLDWAPLVEGVLEDVRKKTAVGLISSKFHNALVEAIVEVSKRAGMPRVVMSGGCFQNRYLTERAVQRLQQQGFRPYWHQRIPPNDGGIALGQVLAARAPSPGALTSLRASS